MTDTVRRVIDAVQAAIKAAVIRRGRDLPRALRWDIYAALKFSAGMDLPEIEAEYNERIVTIITDYAESDRPITAFRYEYRRDALTAFELAAVAGFIDGGGDGPLPDKIRDWVNAEFEREVAHIDSLFAELRQLRGDGAPADEIAEYAQNKADGYTSALQGVHDYARMAAADIEGEWRLGATEEHCETCAELNGQIHPLTWYADNDYIPQQRGSATLECGGWNCDCTIVDPATGRQLVP